MKGTAFSIPGPYQKKPLRPEGQPQSNGPAYQSVHLPREPFPAVPLEQGVPDHPLIGTPGALGPFETPDPLATEAGQIQGKPGLAGQVQYPATGSPMLNMPGMMPLDLSQILGNPTPESVGVQTEGLEPAAAEMEGQEVAETEIEDPEKKRKAMKAIYGDDFPLASDKEKISDYDWCRWVENRWTLHRPGVQQNIWMAERNRQFRLGNQYQSRINATGAWREQPMPRDAVRITDNRIRPALAWSIQVVSEQRPGWQFSPTNNDPDRERKADAQQRAVEYQYQTQNKRTIDRESMYWAQTDGVCFQMTGWDPEAGPWEEQGQGAQPLGEPFTKVYRIEQVCVSSEATANVSPMYWIVRDLLPIQQAVALYGPEVAENIDSTLLAQGISQYGTANQYAYQPLYQNQQTVARFTVFCDKRMWLPQGMMLIVVGKKVVWQPTPLLMGRVPMIRVTDGSEDPAFYPTPKMNLLIPAQMRVNMLWSKWYESIRKNSGGRFASITGAVSAETFIGGETSILEVRAPVGSDIRQSFLPVQGFSVGNDIKEALDREIQTIEQLTGYTKEARGQFENDESGRAILAQRETMERVFAPQAGALADASTEWAKQMVGWMGFGYKMPRKIAITGDNRSDLATEISAADMDGIVDVQVDPASMVPKPQALRQWELDNAYDRGIIDKNEWRRRALFGNVKDIKTPNDVQYAKGKRVSQQIMLGQPQEPIVWQDDEAIQQTVLEEDIILAGGMDPLIQQMAQMRWQQLAMQARQKAMAMMGAGPPQQGSPDGKPPKGEPIDPRIAPIAAGNPSAGGQSAAARGGPGVSAQEQAAAQFESRQVA